MQCRYIEKQNYVNYCSFHWCFIKRMSTLLLDYYVYIGTILMIVCYKMLHYLNLIVDIIITVLKQS